MLSLFLLDSYTKILLETLEKHPVVGLFESSDGLGSSFPDTLQFRVVATSLASIIVVWAILTVHEVQCLIRYCGRTGIRKKVFPPARTTRRYISFALDSLAAPRATQAAPTFGIKVGNKMKSAPSSAKKRFASLSRHRSGSSVGSANSQSSDDTNPRGRSRSRSRKTGQTDPLPPPVLVYHESARSIVFRDHLRRAADHRETKEKGQVSKPQDSEASTGNDGVAVGNSPSGSQHSLVPDIPDMASLFFPEHIPSPAEAVVEIHGYQPNIVPLPHLELGPNDEFSPLLNQDIHDHTKWTTAEREVFAMINEQRAVVKTVKNSDWTSFLHRFKTAQPNRGRGPDNHNDVAPDEKNGLPFNSFVTSTSLLPAGGLKMRCYGAPSVYTTGVVFELPKFGNVSEEEAAATATRTWSWPSGYSAKTEFNIDSKGNLINGRQEALVSLSTLRQNNNDYLNKSDYMIAGRLLKGGLKTVPYNEVFVRVGGRGRIVDEKDCATGEVCVDQAGNGRSLHSGVGLPAALFVRTATFGHLISLLRTRARLMHLWGEDHVQGIPLLLVSSESGVRVLTDELQRDLLKIAARSLNPFQNPIIAHKTTIDMTDEKHLETKVEELIDLDDKIRETLTPEECVRLAGGFGATDDSIAQILKDAMIQDKANQRKGADSEEEESHRLQDIVNEGLASAVRSGDYYTSRQLLILYSLVASEGHNMDIKEDDATAETIHSQTRVVRTKKLDSDAMLLKRQSDSNVMISNRNSQLPPPPPPPPLDTDRLRSATNSDGLLAVLGAAQVLKAMRDGGAKKRTEESFLAVEE